MSGSSIVIVCLIIPLAALSFFFILIMLFEFFKGKDDPYERDRHDRQPSREDLRTRTTDVAVAPAAGPNLIATRKRSEEQLARRRDTQPKYDRSRRRHRWKGGTALDAIELSRRLDIFVAGLADRAPSYSTKTIPKRSGGVRTLNVPDEITADLQRRILHRLLKRLTAHESATGFEARQSIVDNALPHAAREVVVRMDIIEFFPSTTAERIERYFKWIGWDEQCAALLTQWTTHDGGLPQGAPTSPRLSNLVNRPMDVFLDRIAKQYGGTYTRYADDITFSFDEDRPDKMRGLIQVVHRILRAYGYTMHTRKKLNIRRRHQRQEVTGLVVNDGVRLPRETRRWLRAVKHHHATGKPLSITEEQLRGWLAYERMVDEQSGRET